jgi:hypothetical protein
MADYRCYLLNGEAHILRVEVASHDTDEKALQWLEELCRDLPQTCAAIEVWQRDRLIERRDGALETKPEDSRASAR